MHLALVPVAAALVAIAVGAFVLASDEVAPRPARAPSPPATAALPAPGAPPVEVAPIPPAVPSRSSGPPAVTRPRAPSPPPPGEPARAAPPEPLDSEPLDDGLLVALLRAARSHDVDSRRAAARALGSFYARAGADRLSVQRELEALLVDASPDVAAASARALAAVPAGAPSLARRLGGGDTPDAVHLACLESLGAVGRVQDVEALMPWTKAEPPLRETAAWAVSEICARAGVEPPAGLPDTLPPPGS